MSDAVIPGTTVEYPNPEYQGYSSPTDALAINVAYLVDADFRRAMRGRDVSLKQEHGSCMDPAQEAFYADEAKKRLGISFGADYKFPEGFTARTFQQAFFKCISPRNLRDEGLTVAEQKNLEHVFSLMKDLNPEAFAELKVSDLSDKEKFDMVLGMCSKFTMEDINHFMHLHRTEADHKRLPGIQFIMSEGTEAKLNNVLKQHDTSLAYLGDYVFPDWSRVPEQDFKIIGLRQHHTSDIVNEIRQNPDRFFNALISSSNPAGYAERFLSTIRSHNPESALPSDKTIGARLWEIRKIFKERAATKGPSVIPKVDILARRGISKLLDVTQKLPPTSGRRTLKRAIVSGYRFFYPKGNGDR